jgi:hypothetical protein
VIRQQAHSEAHEESWDADHSQQTARKSAKASICEETLCTGSSEKQEIHFKNTRCQHIWSETESLHAQEDLTSDYNQLHHSDDEENK